MVLFLCVNLLRARPFTRPVTWFVVGAGLTLVVGSLISQVLRARVTRSWWTAINYLAQVNDFPKPSASWTVDLVPTAIGIVLLV